MKYCRYILTLAIFTLILAGCSVSTLMKSKDGPPSQTLDATTVPNAMPKVLPKSKYGNPSYYCVDGNCYHVLKSSKGYNETGIASWYGTKFNHQLTSNRETYDMFKMTAASTELPLPTFVKVTNLENGKQVIVKVNDRGPFREKRILDLSYVAAKKLDMLAKGTALVRVQAIDPRKHDITKTTTVKPMKHPAIYLQVGAYANHGNATRMQQHAGKITNLPCKIYKGTLNGKTIYRVKVGPIYSVATADKVTKELGAIGLKKTRPVVQQG